MQKSDLLQYCRYYKGEDSCPLFDKKICRYAWEVENQWVEEALLQEVYGELAKTPNINRWKDAWNHYVPSSVTVSSDIPTTLVMAIHSLFLFRNELPIYEEFLVFFDKWKNRTL